MYPLSDLAPTDLAPTDLANEDLVVCIERIQAESESTHPAIWIYTTDSRRIPADQIEVCATQSDPATTC